MKPLIDLQLVTKSCRVAPDAWERATKLAKKHKVRISDVVSLSLKLMPEDDLVSALQDQQKFIDGLPRQVRGMMRNIHKLSDEERDILIAALKK